MKSMNEIIDSKKVHIGDVTHNYTRNNKNVQLYYGEETLSNVREIKHLVIR